VAGGGRSCTSSSLCSSARCRADCVTALLGRSVRLRRQYAQGVSTAAASVLPARLRGATPSTTSRRSGLGGGAALLVLYCFVYRGGKYGFGVSTLHGGSGLWGSPLPAGSWWQRRAVWVVLGWPLVLFAGFWWRLRLLRLRHACRGGGRCTRARVSVLDADGGSAACRWFAAGVHWGFGVLLHSRGIAGVLWRSWELDLPCEVAIASVSVLFVLPSGLALLGFGAAVTYQYGLRVSPPRHFSS